MKNLLIEKSANIIEGIYLKNDNYEIAMELLRNRFDNKQLLISLHMKSLLDIESVVDIENIQSL